MRRSTDRNVLFVIVDDLRQQLAHTSPLEGEDTSFMVTPVLDGLAREAVSFRRAHVQIAVCAPAVPPEERPFEPFDEEKECTPCAA